MLKEYEDSLKKMRKNVIKLLRKITLNDRTVRVKVEVKEQTEK